MPDALHCEPLYWQWTVGALLVVVVHNILGQTKVADLDNVILGEEDVAAGEVAVHHPLAGQVLHAARHLVRPAQQVLGADRPQLVGARVVAADVGPPAGAGLGGEAGACAGPGGGVQQSRPLLPHPRLLEEAEGEE